MKLTWGVTCGAVLAASLASAEMVSVETYAGPVDVASEPARIAVLDVAAIDNLDALGVRIDGAPESLFVEYLDDVAEHAAPVGTLFEPNYEALAILAPDLIVAGGRSSVVVDQLNKVAPTVDMTIWGSDHVAQVLSRLEALASITGRQEQEAVVRAAFEAKIAEAKAAVAGKGDALILMTNGPAISVYGAGSRFGWLHAALDLPEAAEGVDAQTHGEAVSFEFVAQTDPEWLLVVDRGAAIGAEGASAESTLDNALIAGTTAAKSGQIIYLNAADVYIAGGGVQSMMRTLDHMIAGFKK